MVTGTTEPYFSPCVSPPVIPGEHIVGLAEILTFAKLRQHQ